MEQDIDYINKILEKQVFNIKVHDFNVNVKVKITGFKQYLYLGEPTKHLEYTMYILPTNPDSDMFYSYIRALHGKEVDIRKTPKSPFINMQYAIHDKLHNYLKYFSMDLPVICDKIINTIPPANLKESKKINEDLIVEGKLDMVTRKLVQDIIQIFKYQRDGEFDLPEDLGGDEMVYSYPGFDGFTITLNLELNDNIDGVDVNGDLYYDDDLVVIKIISNPNAGYTILDELTQELNEVIRHELEHIRQHTQGYKFPKKEPKSPEKYYSQPHELEAQRAGFKKKSKSTKVDFETLVRDWFEKNQHKHDLTPVQKEKVIKKILDNNA